jgi:hypothetical protein
MIRMQNNMPPSDDCITNWKTIQNLERQKSEYFDNRRREVRDKDNPGEFISRKRPDKRNDQYIDRDTGLPKPYGKYSEFHPNKSTFKRHFKNMKPLPKISEENEEKNKIVQI